MTRLTGVRLTASLTVAVALAQIQPRADGPQGQTVPSLAGKIMTVLGAIPPDDLGPTLMHEHIFIDFQRPAHLKDVRQGQHRDITAATDVGLFLQPVSLRTLSAVRNGVAPNRDNLYLTDMDDAIDEVSRFKRWGGDTIVDVTSIGLGRDPKGLAQVARATGLHIVMGAGYYQKQFHPPDMDLRTIEQLTEVIVRDVARGVDDTAIRSGIIGEVGVEGNPLTPNEMKSIRAAARAGRATGAAISFHVGGYMEEKFQVLDAVAAEGADLHRVIMGHSNSIANDLPFMRRLLARGVYIQFDTLGRLGSRLGTVDDGKVAVAVADLTKAGFADRILLSQDVCHKIELTKYGGTGYSYVMEFVLPELRRLGVAESDIHKIMVENPRRTLTFVAPQTPLTSTAGH
jgi:phosphotriesterase-related protein